MIIKLVNKMIDLKIKWQHCWYIFQWGEMGKREKVSMQAFIGGFQETGYAHRQ